MSATDIIIAAVSIDIISPGSQPYSALSGAGAFQETIYDISTLSTNNGETPAGGFWGGLFYVPTLLPEDATLCENVTLVPQSIIDKSNATSNRLVPKIAFAPWAPAPCQQAYFRAASSASRLSAFLTYLDDGSSGPAPLANDTRFDLGDGGAWLNNSFPIYAVNGMTGASFLEILSNYTEPIPGRPTGVQTWVAAEIDLPSGNGLSVLPNLWTIVLAVLAVFIVVLASMSGILHLIQRKRRRDLRRRILTGQVALEDIGIRKIVVPQELMDKMPVREYGTLAGQAVEPAVPVEKAGADKASKDNGPAMMRHYNQPTCPICLDDFGAETSVRCLPCDHIFHPECCDSFLRENSSLCPMCKKSVLPRGYCPEKVTNAMVRRERLTRIRAQEAAGEAGLQQPHQGAAARVRGVFHARRAGGSSPVPPPPAAVEMTTPAPQAVVPISAADLPPPAAAGASPADNCTPSRREWARRRALQLLGNHATTAEDEEAERATRAPAWRRAIAKVFPSSSNAS